MHPIVWVKEYKEKDTASAKGMNVAGRWKRYVDSKETGERLINGIGVLEPGEDMGWHSHPEEEVFFVLSGHGLARWEIDNEVFEAELLPRYAFYKVGNVPHQMVNIGDVPLVGIFAKVSGD